MVSPDRVAAGCGQVGQTDEDVRRHGDLTADEAGIAALRHDRETMRGGETQDLGDFGGEAGLHERCAALVRSRTFAQVGMLLVGDP